MGIVQFALLFMFAGLTACASNPAQHDRFMSYLKDGKYDKAYGLAESQFTYNNNKAKDTAKYFLEDYPESLPHIVNYYENKIPDSKYPIDAITFSTSLNAARRYGLLSSPDYEQLVGLLNRIASEKNQSNDLPFLLTDDYRSISTLTNQENKRIIFNRSVDQLKTSMSHPLAIDAILVVKEEGIDSPEYNYLLDAIPSLLLRKEILTGEFQELYPEIARERLNMITAKINIYAPPEDADYLYGIKEQLEKNNSILLVDKDCSECFSVKINKIRFVEREDQEKTQTITYDRSQVNIVSAVLLMPDYATYQYEQKTGGYSIDYTFNVVVEKGGEKILEKTIKDKESESYRSCSSPTVRNAFGGVSPAGFTANADMQSKCSSSTQSVDPEKVYEKVMTNLANGIISLPPIYNRINYGMH